MVEIPIQLAPDIYSGGRNILLLAEHTRNTRNLLLQYTFLIQASFSYFYYVIDCIYFLCAHLLLSLQDPRKQDRLCS